MPPRTVRRSPFSAAPFSAAPFSAAPFSAAPFSAAPFSAAPFSAAPAARVLALGALLLGAPLARGDGNPPPDGDPRSLEQRVRDLEKLVQDLRAQPPAAPAQVVSKTDYQPAKAPFEFGDFSWVPGGYGPPDHPLGWGPFTGELRIDVPYHYSLANPKDHTISGSSEVFRHNEFQVTQIGIGGDFYYKGVHARLMTQFGMYSQTTPRNDASPSLGQWQLDNAYRYISEAYGGYHINVLHGINIQAGIFMSYVGLWSYYNFDNWTYQPSYVSSNTPWFFNGMRIQIFPTEKLKVELWLVNGWQAYGKFNEAPGLGLQLLWRPREWVSVLGNQYYGADTLGIPGRQRLHTDDSIMFRAYRRPDGALSTVALSLTLDAGCEFGDPTNHVSCTTQYFLGFMAYLRAQFVGDRIGVSFGGGAITNPGRYLVLIPPINGATAYSGTSYFTANPGDPFKAWDLQATLDYMPNRYITFRLEYNHRAASVRYFSGPDGITPPAPNGAAGYVNQGTPGSMVDGWKPDLVNAEDRLTAALMLRM